MITGMRDYQQEAVDATIRDLNGSLDCAPLIALPTGAGKTYVIAGLIDAMLTDDPDATVLVISHVKEILMQNRESIEGVLNRSVSTYSAGLGTKQVGQITVAGIQSIYRNAEPFYDFNLIIIDEAHLIPPAREGMYRTFLAEMIHSRVVGLTATPFRMSSGYIYGEDRIFSHVSSDLTCFDGFNRLLDGGYLCKLSSKATQLKLNSDVKITGGDFNEKALAEANNRDEITKAAIEEMVELGKDRKKWLIFAIDIDHAENIARALNEEGHPAEFVHSRMEKDRDGIIRRFKDGEFRCLVNVNILTTGFDSPDIDLIALLRPTQSPVLHVQTIGRGLRIHPLKSDCLILDFAGNINRLGCINDITVRTPKKRNKDAAGEARAKTCPECDELNHPRAKECVCCGHIFVMKEKIKAEADWSNPIKESKRTTKAWFAVKDVQYGRYTKIGSPPMVKASYDLGGKTIHKYICVEHTGWAKIFADNFVKEMGLEYCGSVKDFIDRAEKHDRKPTKILVETEGKYPEILEVINKKSCMEVKM